jgi:diaminopimelate epimerase
MQFTKMHGAGNDYVYVDATKEKIENASELAVKVSDRHFGIGSDGLILICPSEVADFRMEMYNADGSLGAMCGNGIRCVGKYVYDHGLTDKTQVKIETGSGIKILDLTVEKGKVSHARVNMGEPILEASKIPVVSDNERVIDEDILVDGKIYKMTAVSMGNPHCVVFIDKDPKQFPLENIGPYFENHKRFPDRVNTEFIHVEDEHTISMRVWERGSGETLACGTGACASAVAGILNGYIKTPVSVKLLGGELKIEWEGEGHPVYMTGPATEVFGGNIDV